MLNLTPDLEAVMAVSRYLNLPLKDVKEMSITEFNLWLMYIEKHPPLDVIVDTHLSKLISSVSGKYPFEESILIPESEKKVLKKQLDQKKIIEALKEL